MLVLMTKFPEPAAAVDLTVKYPFPAEAKPAKPLLVVELLGTKFPNKIANWVLLHFTTAVSVTLCADVSIKSLTRALPTAVEIVTPDSE
ncbi:hypothetical protein BANRA_02778 [Acinetobacter baumannii]|nr:hypothetical protein BANRA_02778 [Acinetobacter baumannii]